MADSRLQPLQTAEVVPARKLVARAPLGGQCAPVAANGTPYIVSRGYLWALRQPIGAKAAEKG